MKRSIELKIKVKSLMAEAAIIRKEEGKLQGMDKWYLQHHRKTVVRDAARRTLMAYAHIRGKDINANASKDKATRAADIAEALKMIKKYGDKDAIERLVSVK